jgi:cytochrome P450
MSVITRSSLDDELRLILTGDTESIQNPYPVFNRLREQAPLYRYDSQTVIVSRHADVKATYHDDEHFPATPALGTKFDGQMRFLGDEELAMMDEFAAFDKHTISRKNGDDHVRVRRAAHRYLTPRRVLDFEPTFQRIFDELIAERADQDVFDFMPVAYKLPLLVITEVLGVPRDDAEQVKAWGDAWTLTNQNPIPPEAVRYKRQVLDEYRGYVQALIDGHRNSETKSELVASMLDAADQDRLTEDELVAFFLHTLFAGHETTQHLIGNGLRALLLHRDQWRMLCDDPALVPSAVEECLRFDGPTLSISKRSAAGAQVSGESVPEGLDVILLAAAANRDPDVFEEPERFDILRQPNDHLMLGFGRHFCLGASLARLEGRIVFGTLTCHYPELDFATDPASLRYHRGLRGLDEFPIRLGARRD